MKPEVVWYQPSLSDKGIARKGLAACLDDVLQSGERYSAALLDNNKIENDAKALTALLLQ